MFQLYTQHVLRILIGVCLVVIITAGIFFEINRWQQSERSGKKIGCYLQTWANYRQGDGKFDFSNIDPNLCTHIVYAFAKLQNNQIESSDPWLDLPSGLNGYGKFNALKQRNPALMTLLSIGGWNEGSQKYSQMASSSSSRSTFVQSVVQYLRKYGFDGLDMDWEYPTMRGGRPEDKRNFVLLLQDLKAALQPQGMLLTAAVGGGKSIVDAAYDVPGISRALDLIHVMTYDYHLSTEGQTGYNAPLYPAAGSTTGDKQLTVDFSVNYWINAGAAREKLIVGLATYGHSYTLRDARQTGVHAPSVGPGTPGPYVKEPGVLGFNEVCMKLVHEGWVEVWDGSAKVPYAYKGNQWVSYDNQRSIGAKVDYLLSKDLGGAMVWSLDMDDFRGACYGKRFYLVSTAANKLL